MNEELKIIKKKYGEDMMHFIRENFPNILDTKPGKISSILLSHFAPTHFLYEDIANKRMLSVFKNNIYSYIEEDNKDTSKVIEDLKNPYALMSDAGYNLYKCESESDIQSFRKYYKYDEKLCTFNGNRLSKCYVYFAVKKDADKIKREDFPHPRRQDKYGTSVISIQFSRDSSHTLSIKNRYNHTVEAPDATFSNNLDNIIAGLTDSFSKYEGMEQKRNAEIFELSNYVYTNEGIYHRYNLEYNNTYYCSNNVIINNFQSTELPKESYLLMDSFIVDYRKNIIFQDRFLIDSFIDSIGKIKKIVHTKENDKVVLTITPLVGEDVTIKVNKYGNIVYYKNPNVTEIGNRFLYYSKNVEEIILPNVEKIGNCFMYWNNGLKSIDLPNVKYIDDCFLELEETLKFISCPKLLEVGNGFIPSNTNLLNIDTKNLVRTGSDFASSSKRITTSIFPNLTIVGNDFMSDAMEVETINMPLLRKIGYNFFKNCQGVQKIEFSSLEIVDSTFFEFSQNLKSISLPNVKTIGNNFQSLNQSLEEIYLDNCTSIKDHFLFRNENLKEIHAPLLRTIGNGFLANNNTLTEINLPNVETIGTQFLKNNHVLKVLHLDNTRKVDYDFVPYKESLEEVYLPKLKTSDEDDFYYAKNKTLKKDFN